MSIVLALLVEFLIAMTLAGIAARWARVSAARRRAGTGGAGSDRVPDSRPGR